MKNVPRHNIVKFLKNNKRKISIAAKGEKLHISRTTSHAVYNIL